MPMSLKMIQWASSSLLTNFKYELELCTPSGHLLLSPSHLVLYMLPTLVKPSASLLLMPTKLPLVLTEFVKAKKWAPIVNLLFLLKYEPSLLVKAEMSGVPSNLRHDRWTFFSEKTRFFSLFVSHFYHIPSPSYFSLLLLFFTFSYSFSAVAFLKKITFSLKGLFTNFFLSFKSHILDSNGVWYRCFWSKKHNF